MASKNRKKDQLEMMTSLAKTARDNIASFVPEATFGRLKRSFFYIVTRKRIIVYSIYYWARFVNDGRRAIFASDDRPLIFFIDPEDDPRIEGDYPRRPEDIRRLTSDEFKAAVEAGLVVITKQVGPAAGLQFLEKGIRKTRGEVPPKLRELVSGRVRDLIRRGRNKITVRL